VATCLALGLAACGRSGPPTASPKQVPSPKPRAAAPTGLSAHALAEAKSKAGQAPYPELVPSPSPLAPFSPAGPGPGSTQGQWTPAGRKVAGSFAVWETYLVPPGGSQAAGIAWMNMRLLRARLYSGSISPGGGPYRYSAPVAPAQAARLVAAFNGGFKMADAHGGYYTDARTVVPLVQGAASLVFYSDGTVDIGPWDVPGGLGMTSEVVSVRQNLVMLVSGGQPTSAAQSPDWLYWGDTCGRYSCASNVPGVEHQWRSGVGITAHHDLVYVTGPDLDPLQLAQLLARAGALRAMELDINPYWTVMVTYAPATPGGKASPTNGSKLLPSTVQGPATFFEPSWGRDFVTLSARGSLT